MAKVTQTEQLPEQPSGDVGQSLTLEDWKNAWANNSIGWHLDHVNTDLIENIEFLTDGKQSLRILVPFCGKSLDLLWLVQQGHTVIGIEIVQKAIEDFFKENNVAYEKEIVDGYGHCYKGFDGKLKLFDCDYMKFNSSLAGGKCDAIWDCNALGAIPPDTWKQHLQTSLELLNHAHGRILLQALLYDQKEYLGPPFSVRKEELSRLLGDSYELELLSKKETERDEQKMFGVSWIYNTTIAVKYKS